MRVAFKVSLLLAFALAVSQQPWANAGNGWIIDQKHKLLGNIRLYLADSRVRLETPDQGNIYIADAKTGTLEVFNLRTKRFHAQKLIDFRVGLSYLSVASADYEIQKENWKPKGSIRLSGVAAKLYEQKAKYSGRGLINGFLPGNRKFSTNTAEIAIADNIKVDRAISKFLSAIEATPNLDGVPLLFQRRYGHEEFFHELETQKVAHSVDISGSQFKLPSGLKKVWSLEAVTTGDSGLLDEFLKSPGK